MADRQHLTMFLIKAGVADPERIVRGFPGPRVSRLSLSAETGMDGEVYLKRPSANEPSWFPFVRQGVANPRALTGVNTSISAVLLVRRDQRTFAIAFGYGRTMLDPEVLEPRFGLLVVLNAVDPELLRSVDARTLEEVSLQTRRQLSRGAPIRSFELDLDRDLLRGVAGQPQKKGFADRLAGSVALAIESELEFADIPAKCSAALRLFTKKTYKRRFPWVDHVQLVSDPQEVELLDRKLNDELSQQHYEILYLASPEIIDYERIDHFRYSADPDGRFYELDWSDYLATVRRGPPTISRLKRESVGAYYAASPEPDFRWSIYRCLVAELPMQNTIYVLSAGEWFAVEKTFARKTLRELREYEKPADPLPDAMEGEAEGVYNRRACQQIGADAVLMDTVPVRATDGQDNVEFCDIYMAGRIIHVKRKSASSTLSHLFMQGLISGELLQADAGFRREVHQRIANQNAAVAATVPADGAVDSADYEVVFAVIAKAPRANRHFLPFFSQVSFTRAARLLSQRGYDVALTRIPET
jgi:uncharacterized protein (TIGR04141 family)